MSILVEDELLIGRQAEGAGRLADDDEISRSHARVTLDASGFCAIEDLGSTNGTFINGLRISSPTTIAAEDLIEVGSTTLAVRELPDHAREESGTQRPPAGQNTVVPAPEPAEPAASVDDIGRPAANPEPGSPHAGQTPPPPLALQVEVDPAAREARIHVEGSAEPIRLELDDGRWRPAPQSS
jgi:pSer/pThr/pTyr-binding forkhead associated (FHA) protein